MRMRRVAEITTTILLWEIFETFGLNGSLASWAGETWESGWTHMAFELAVVITLGLAVWIIFFFVVPVDRFRLLDHQSGQVASAVQAPASGIRDGSELAMGSTKTNGAEPAEPPPGTRLRILRFALQAARKQAGLSQAQLAEKVGISESYVAMLETGSRSNPSWKVVTALAAVCGVAVYELAAINEIQDLIGFIAAVG